MANPGHLQTNLVLDRILVLVLAEPGVEASAMPRPTRHRVTEQSSGEDNADTGSSVSGGVDLVAPSASHLIVGRRPLKRMHSRRLACNDEIHAGNVLLRLQAHGTCL